MMYDKKEFERGGLIAILRNCGEAGVRACSECPLEPVYHGDVQCIGDLMTAAADRLEEYVDRCARFSEEIMVLREQLQKIEQPGGCAFAPWCDAVREAREKAGEGQG